MKGAWEKSRRPRGWNPGEVAVEAVVGVKEDGICSKQAATMQSAKTDRGKLEATHEL